MLTNQPKQDARLPIQFIYPDGRTESSLGMMCRAISSDATASENIDWDILLLDAARSDTEIEMNWRPLGKLTLPVSVTDATNEIERLLQKTFGNEATVKVLSVLN
jgi:hypothetical protein